MIVKPETAFGYQANSKVSFGVIGTGGRGIYVGSHMTRDANARLAAICDIFPDRIDHGQDPDSRAPTRCRPSRT